MGVSTVPLDAFAIALGSVRDFGPGLLLGRGDLTSFIFSDFDTGVDFDICLELFRGVDTVDSLDFSSFDAVASFFVGDCVLRALPLEGDSTVSSAGL